jgi:RND family efflux transporter MFP subunit
MCLRRHLDGQGVAIMWQHPMRALVILSLAGALIACGEGERKASAPPIRPVRTVTVTPTDVAERVSLTGEIQARYQSDLGFRIDGKIIERPVDVGSAVKKGQLLARLDPQPRQQDLQAAKANVASAQATLTQAQAQESRQSQLLKDGFTTRTQYDDALRNLKTAQAQLDSAQARERQAQDNVAYTELRADNDGVITAVGADAGQVVAAGQMVVRLARPDEREAVFNVAEAMFRAVPRNPPVEVTLVSNPEIRTIGAVRYVSPQADPTTRTYTVRISLPNAPPEMRLGATVSGSVALEPQKVVELPGTALFEKDGKPAVWIVAKDGTVDLRKIEVERYQGEAVIVSAGLEPGEVVVTAGVQKLLPGQKVRVADAAAK